MADLNIDSLQLQIAADTQQAERSLNRLSSSLATLNRSLETVSRHTNDVSKIAYAFTSMQNLQMPNLSSFITQLETMSRIDLKNIENKKINLDIRLTGASEAERMKYAIEDAVNNTKIDTKRISKQLQEAFRLSPDVKKELQEQLDLMTQDFAKGGGGMSQFEKMYQILDKMGQMTRAEFEKASNGVSDSLATEYKEFLDYVRNHPISTSLLDKKNGHSGAMSEWNEEIRNKGLGAYFRKEGSKLDTGLFRDLVEQFPTVMAGYRDLVDGEHNVTVGAIGMKDAIKEALETAKSYLNGTVSPQENTKAAGNAVYGVYNDLIKRVNAEKEKSMRESATKIPMDFDIDENRLFKQVENAVKTISKHDFGKVNIKLDVDTTSMVQSLLKSFKAEQFKGLGTLTTNIKEVADAMHSFDGLDMKSNGLASFTRGLAMLSKESKNLDDSVFTRVADGLLELERASSATGIAETFTPFIRSINTFIGSAKKMGEAANAFPTLALEIQEFFSELANIDISDKTLRMAEAFAAIAKSGKKAGTSLQSMKQATQKTGEEITRTTMIMNGFTKATSALESLFKKLGGSVLNGIKNLVSQFGQLGKHSSSVGTLTSNVKTLLATLIGFRGIQGIFNWTKEMMTMGANVTEIDHIVESVFGENMIGYVNEWASNAIEKFGIAATSAKQYAGTLSAMFQASNISMKNSNQMALDMVELAGDLSAFYNIDTEDAYKKIQSGLTGMVRPLRSLGIDLSVATLKEFALAQGINKSWNEMTQAEKVMLRYQYLMQNTKTQQGDFERTSLSLANSMRTLRAYVSETTTQLGVGFGAAIRHVVVWLNSLMKYILKASQAFAVFMQTLFGKYKGGASGAALGDTFGLDDASGDAESLADGANDASDGLGDAADNAEKLKKELSVLPFDELNQLNKDQEKTSSGNGSGGGAGGGIGGLGGFADDLFNWEESDGESALSDAEKMINGWAQRIKARFDAKDWVGLGNAIAKPINRGIDYLYDLFDENDVSNKINPWIDAFTTTFNQLIKKLNFDKAGRLAGRGINNIVNAFNRLTTQIDWLQIGQKLAEGLNGLVDEINWDNLGTLFGNKLMIVWRMLYGFAADFKWDEFGKHLGEGINAFNDSVDLSLIFDALVTSLNGIFDSLKNFTKTVKWDDIASNISSGINTAIHNFKWKENGAALNDFIQRLLETITKIAKETDWTALGEGIGDALSQIDWAKALSEVATTICHVLGGLLSGMAKTPAGLFLEGFAGALVVGKIALGLDAFTAGISTFLSGTKSVGIVTQGFQALMGSAGVSGVTAALAGLTPVLLPIAGVLGVALIGAVWGNTAEGQAEMERCKQALTTDIETGLHGVEGAFDGTGYSIEQKQKDTADAIIRENTRWKDQLLWQVIPAYVKANGEAAGSAFELQRAVTLNDDEMISKLEEWARQNTNYTGQIVQSNQGVETSVRTTTNHWKDCYDGVINHLRQIAEDHDGQVTLMQNKVGEFVSAVETGLSTTGQSWKTLSVDEEGHKQTLLESLDEQIEKVHTWEENLAVLAKAGIDEGFLNELARMGTDGAPLVESAVAQINSEGGIDTLNSKWEELINAQGLMDNVGKTLKDAGITNIETAFGEVTSKVEGEGKNIVEGGAKGIKDNISIFTDANEKMGEDGWAAFRTYIRSGSPSKLYEDEGKNIIDGIKLGIQRNETQVTGAMSKMAKNMESAFKNTIDIGGMIDAAFKDIQNICTTVYNYGVDIGQSFADGIQAVSIPAPYIYVSSYDWIDLGDGAGFSVPNFNVDWYAKGGLFTDFAVFGEAGDEAALPLENQKVMKRIASAITETGNLGLDQETLSSAVARGYVQAMMANQGNERPIDVYATLYTENNEVLARAVQRGQQSIDYRNNPTASYGY